MQYLSKAINKVLIDNRRQASCQHSLVTLVRQRLYALALGYEDVNDHIELRHDIALQTCVSEINSLTSSSTLHRFEQQSDRQTAIALHQVLFDQFVQKHKKPPRRLVLDCDATDTPLHGEQEERFFHGYYGH